MREQPGFEIDREVWRLVFGEGSVRVPPFSSDNASADLLLWRLAQSGVAFKVQELDDVHYCMLWSGATAPRPGLATGSAGTRPLAICRAVLRLWEVAPLRSEARPSGGPPPPRTSV